VGIVSFPYTLAFGYPDTVDIPKGALAEVVDMERGKREFVEEVRAHLAVRAEGVVLSLRTGDVNGAVQLPLRPEDVPVGSEVRIWVEQRPSGSQPECEVRRGATARAKANGAPGRARHPVSPLSTEPQAHQRSGCGASYSHATFT